MSGSVLVIPCAGLSTRFPGVRPKWMLTHPDGKLMLEKVLDGIVKDNSFDRIIIVTLQEYVDKYEADLWVFGALGEMAELLVLPERTSSASETVRLAIQKLGLEKDAIVIKDSDSYVEVELIEGQDNFVVTLDIETRSDVRNVGAKSFIVDDGNGVIVDVAEKKIISNMISVGVYGFETGQEFISAYDEITKWYEGELYVSQIVSSVIVNGGVFKNIACSAFLDWGTKDDWEIERCKFKTYFVDIDGVVFGNKGKYGSSCWGAGDDLPLKGNISRLIELQSVGAQLIFCTARPEVFRNKTEQALEKVGFSNFRMIMDCYHGQRVIINDYAASNPFPSCSSVSIKRDEDSLADYI